MLSFQQILTFSVERKIREARHDLGKVNLWLLKDDGDGEEKGKEHNFWLKLRELRLIPESKAFGLNAELADKLADLRNSAVLCLLVVNSIWLILVGTLAAHTELDVISTNPLGVAFLIVFGFILAIQFLTMLWHRISTFLHFVSRAPFRAGDTSLKGWAFNDDDLPPPPSEEELQKIREKRARHHRKRSRELVLSGEHDNSGERAPLLNGRPGTSYAAAPRTRLSPLPV